MWDTRLHSVVTVHVSRLTPGTRYTPRPQGLMGVLIAPDEEECKTLYNTMCGSERAAKDHCHHPRHIQAPQETAARQAAVITLGR